MHVRLRISCVASAIAPRGWSAAALAVIALVLVAAAPAAAEFSCAATVMAGCVQGTPPHPSGLWMNVRASHRRDNVVWKWHRGQSSTDTSWADPTTNDDYAFCLYTENDGQTSLLFGASAPAASQCKGRSCWRKTGTGYRYRTGTGLPNGLTKIYLDARDQGRARIVLKGRGENLSLPDLPVPLPLRVQLQAANGQCWEDRFLGNGVSKNSDHRFRGRAVTP